MNIWNTDTFRQGLNGIILESVDDPVKAKEITDAVAAYGDARAAEAIEDIDQKLRTILYEARAVKYG